MYYFSEPATYSINELKDRLMPNLLQKDHFSGYHLDRPLRLQLITFRPERDDQYYLMTSLEPDLSVYLTMEKQEADGVLSSSLHHHDYYELMFILEGNVYQKIENQRHLYTAGSCCLMNRNVRHSEEYLEENGPFRILFLQISENYLKLVFELFSMHLFQREQTSGKTDLEQFLSTNLSLDPVGEKDYVDFIPKRDTMWIAQNTHRLFDELAGILTSPKTGASYQTVSCMIRLFQLLISKENYTTTPVRIGTSKENLLFAQIQSCMEASHGRISRNELSQVLHYSGSHMNRVVQKITGMSISEYGLSICMKEVARQLRTTDLSIQEITQEMGFSNKTHFYQKFAEIYRMTPAQYRKQNRI